jgi:hypothetical protein
MALRAARRASGPPAGRGSRSVISLATATGRFPEALVRLGESVRATGFAGEFLAWSPGSFPTGCPTHADVPFAFKPFCFAEAGRRGFRAVLWMDSICVAIRSLDAIFGAIEERGYALFRTRGWVGEWSADATLEALGVDRGRAMGWPAVNAAALGLDLGHPLGAEFLRRWHEAARQELPFRGVAEPLETREDYQSVKWNTGGRVSSDPRVKGHRHDQSVAGILAGQLGMTPSPHGLQPLRRDAGSIKRKTVIVVDRDAPRADRPLASVSQLRRARWRGVASVRATLGRAARR